MPQVVKSGLFQSMTAMRGLLVTVLDLLAALCLLGTCLMLVVGLSVGHGEWKLALVPLSGALIFQSSSRLYDIVLRRLNPGNVRIDAVAA